MTTSISTGEMLESLQATLKPLLSKVGEPAQLEACQSLEKLHGELSEWQNELARKQTNLDLREDALEKCQEQEDQVATQVDQWKADLAVAREESGQLQEENVDQLQQLEQLEQKCIELEADLQLARQRSEDLSKALQSERARTQTEQAQWKEEFKSMRELLDKQCSLLASRLMPSDSSSRRSSGALNVEASKRSLELRRRAQARLAANRKKQQEPEEPTPS